MRCIQSNLSSHKLSKSRRKRESGDDQCHCTWIDQTTGHTHAHARIHTCTQSFKGSIFSEISNMARLVTFTTEKCLCMSVYHHWLRGSPGAAACFSLMVDTNVPNCWVSEDKWISSLSKWLAERLLGLCCCSGQCCETDGFVEARWDTLKGIGFECASGSSEQCLRAESL